jgi:hypothetical protein
VLWITLALVVVISGWIGVHMVGEALAPSAVPVLSDSQMDALLSTAEPITKPTDHETARPDQTDEPGHQTSNPTGHASPSSTGRPTSTASSTPTQTTGTRAVIRTFRSRGGSALVSCRGSQLTLVAVSPAPGYHVEQPDVRDDEVEVKFESESGESTIHAQCVSGVPVAQVDSDD